MNSQMTKTSIGSSSSSTSADSSSGQDRRRQAPHRRQDQAAVNNAVSSSTTSGQDLQSASSAATHFCNDPSHKDPIYEKCSEQMWEIATLETKVAILQKSEVKEKEAEERSKELQKKLDEAVESVSKLNEELNTLKAGIDQERSTKDAFQKNMARMKNARELEQAVLLKTIGEKKALEQQVQELQRELAGKKTDRLEETKPRRMVQEEQAGDQDLLLKNRENDPEVHRQEVVPVVEEMNLFEDREELEVVEEPMDQRPGPSGPVIENAGGKWYRAVKIAKARGWYKRWSGQAADFLFNPFPEDRDRRTVPQVVRFTGAARKLSAQEREDLRNVQKAQAAAGLVTATY